MIIIPIVILLVSAVIILMMIQGGKKKTIIHGVTGSKKNAIVSRVVELCSNDSSVSVSDFEHLVILLIIRQATIIMRVQTHLKNIDQRVKVENISSNEALKALESVELEAEEELKALQMEVVKALEKAVERNRGSNCKHKGYKK
jgi:hypothetical protein